jgi:hypothetical protein
MPVSASAVFWSAAAAGLADAGAVLPDAALLEAGAAEAVAAGFDPRRTKLWSI